MDPYIIELPDVCTGPADELWRAEFLYPLDDDDVQLVWFDNLSQEGAERLMLKWRALNPGLAYFGNCCPDGAEMCPHPDTPSFAYQAMHNLRIMPMREAV